MAHGNPRKEICYSCNIYGLTPRFSESKCPECGTETKPITNDELKIKLGLMIHEEIPLSFKWKKI